MVGPARKAPSGEAPPPPLGEAPARPGGLAGLARRAVRWCGAAAEAWLDAVFPPRCAGCDRAGSHFCPRCALGLRAVPPPWCSSCGAPVSGGGVCDECRADPLPLLGVQSAGHFDGPLRQAVHRLKFRGRSGAARALAALLVDPTARLGLDRGALAQLLVVPVPLHAQRERERGYNQSALLARPLAAALGATYRPAAVRRVRATPPQVGLSRRQRRENVRGAFAATGEVAGRVVLLVDDVTTTGSTLGSAAAACLAAGARGVYAVTLARAREPAGMSLAFS